MSTSSDTKATRPPLNPIQIKGIDMVVRGVQKKFPFIIGWEKSEVFDKYQTQMFINLIVDMNKLSKYYNGPIKHYWVEDLEQGRGDSGGGTFYLENHEDIQEISFKNRRGIESFINDVYVLLPKQFQVFVEWSGGSFMFGPNDEPYTSVSSIDVHSYSLKIFK